MEQLIYISLVSSIFISIILVHRIYRGEKLSRKAYYLIWLIISVRLLFPLDISVDKPIYNITSTIEEQGNIFNEVDGKVLVIKEKDTNIIKNIRQNLWKIWLIGTIVYSSYNLLSYILFRIKIEKSLSSVNEGIRDTFFNLKAQIVPNKNILIKESNIIKSPMILGIIKPILLLPNNIKIEDLEFIFRHELIHLRRNDISYKVIIFLATTMHWFNPIVHIMGDVSREDLELSCDEEVVRGMSKDYKFRYSKVLVDSALESRRSTGVVNFFSWGKTMKRRIDLILYDINKKSGKSLIIISIALLLAVSMFFNYEVRKVMEVTEVQTFQASDFIKEKLEYKDNRYEGYLYEADREMKNHRWYVTYQGIVE